MAISKNTPSVDRVRELFEYRDGHLYRKVRTAQRSKVGERAGSKDANGYIRIKVDGVLLGAHRIIWAMHKGYWPSIFLDHINGIRDDNRIENLREATMAQNIFAQIGAHDGSLTGVRGIVFDKRTRQWVARITKNRRKIHLGTFWDIREAAKAYRDAAEKHFGEFANPAHDGL